MLEADLPTIAAHGVSTLATHLHACEACQAVATTLLASTSAMQARYLALTPSVAPAGATIRPRDVRRHAGWAIAALAAAAAVILAVVVRRERGDPLHGGHWVELSDSASTAVSVDVPDGRNAIVFTTRNLKVDIVWIY